MRRAWNDMAIMRVMMPLVLTAALAAAQTTCGPDSECTPIDNINPNTMTTAFTACNSSNANVCTSATARCEQADKVVPSVPCNAKSPNDVVWCDTPYCEDNHCKCSFWLRPNGGCIIKDEGKTFTPLNANATRGLAGFAFIYLIIWACLLVIGVGVGAWAKFKNTHPYNTSPLVKNTWWWTVSAPTLVYYDLGTVCGLNFSKDFNLEFDNDTTRYNLRANQPRKLKGVQVTELQT